MKHAVFRSSRNFQSNVSSDEDEFVGIGLEASGVELDEPHPVRNPKMAITIANLLIRFIADFAIAVSFYSKGSETKRMAIHASAVAATAVWDVQPKYRLGVELTGGSA